MSVKWEDIQVGDKIKVRYNGMVSEDWMTVEDVGNGRWYTAVKVDQWTFLSNSSDVTLIAHQPAPRKVEVTLGKPLTDLVSRPYETLSSGHGIQAYGRAGSIEVGVWDERTGTHLLRALRHPEARRLALDILATTGIED